MTSSQHSLPPLTLDNTVLSFGKYASKTYKYILEHDPSYFNYIYHNFRPALSTDESRLLYDYVCSVRDRCIVTYTPQEKDTIWFLDPQAQLLIKEGFYNPLRILQFEDQLVGEAAQLIEICKHLKPKYIANEQDDEKYIQLQLPSKITTQFWLSHNVSKETIGTGKWLLYFDKVSEPNELDMNWQLLVRNYENLHPEKKYGLQVSTKLPNPHATPDTRNGVIIIFGSEGDRGRILDNVLKVVKYPYPEIYWKGHTSTVSKMVRYLSN